MSIYCQQSLYISYICCILQKLKKKWEQNKAMHQLFIDVKSTYDSGRRETSDNILVEFGVPMGEVRLIKMCLNDTYSRVWIDSFCLTCPIMNGLKQRDVLAPFLFNIVLEYDIMRDRLR